MHKRARNHKIKVDYEMFKFVTLKMLVTRNYKKHLNYEPQGKREAKKCVKGLLYYVPAKGWKI